MFFHPLRRTGHWISTTAQVHSNALVRILPWELLLEMFKGVKSSTLYPQIWRC